MRELRPGLWHREAPHPDWKPGGDWNEIVSSYPIDDGDRLLLFDPLAVPSEIEELAAGRKTAIVLSDTLIDRGQGLELPVDWLPEGVPLEQVVAALRALLELPVELVLATHGGPTDRAALERALS